MTMTMIIMAMAEAWRGCSCNSLVVSSLDWLAAGRAAAAASFAVTMITVAERSAGSYTLNASNKQKLHQVDAKLCCSS